MKRTQKIVNQLPLEQQLRITRENNKLRAMIQGQSKEQLIETIMLSNTHNLILRVRIEELKQLVNNFKVKLVDKLKAKLEERLK